MLSACQNLPTQSPAELDQLQARLEAQQLANNQQGLQLSQLSSALSAAKDREKQLESRLEAARQALDAAANGAHPKKAELREKKPSAAKAETKLAKATEAIDSDDNDLQRITLGRIERIQLPELELEMNARMDTGINSSSISAINLRSFERDGQEWVSFQVEGFDKVHELPVDKYVRIKQAGINKETRRPVVTLRLVIGELAENTSFTLVNRSNLSYPAVVGRAFLRDFAVIDVARTHVHSKPES